MDILSLFFHSDNLKHLKSRTNLDGEYLTMLMTEWAEENSLSSWESIDGNISTVLYFANQEFVKKHKKKGRPYLVHRTKSGRYPKAMIPESTENFNQYDFQSMPAHFDQKTYRMNSDFRYNNEIKKWETSLYNRHLERDITEGLRARELRQQVRGFLPPRKSPYESRDNIAFEKLDSSSLFDIL